MRSSFSVGLLAICLAACGGSNLPDRDAVLRSQGDIARACYEIYAGAPKNPAKIDKAIDTLVDRFKAGDASAGELRESATMLRECGESAAADRLNRASD